MGKRRGQELGSDLLRVFQRTQKNVEAGYPPLTIKWPSPQGMSSSRVLAPTRRLAVHPIGRRAPIARFCRKAERSSAFKFEADLHTGSNSEDGTISGISIRLVRMRTG
jgi:hypothetical protein